MGCLSVAHEYIEYILMVIHYGNQFLMLLSILDDKHVWMTS